MQSANGGDGRRQDKLEESQHGVQQSMEIEQNQRPLDAAGIVWPALQIGGLSGMSGALVGGFAGVLRSSNPLLFALASGLQWFTLGATFWASRGFLLHKWSGDGPTPGNRVYASALAGSISGLAGGILRGRRNIFPGMVMFGLFGGAGQAIFGSFDTRRQTQASGVLGTKASWLNSRWSPMTPMSHGEYEALLRDRLLRVDAEIALLDEKLSHAKGEEQAPKRSLKS